MSVTDAPAWVLAAWRRSLRDVGATADRETVESYGQRMIERWSAPERIHHNLKRLIAVLARVDELAPETHDPDMVRLAAWYHGAVFNAAAQHAYAHRGGVDEEASAELAREELAELGVPEDVVERITAMIQRSSRHAASKSDIDAQALCDADLGGLAVDPQRYAAYRKEVRQEYAHIPQSDYVRARLAIVTKLLSRPYLFRSPMAQPWEDSARENLSAELSRLNAEAAKLPAVDADAIVAAAKQKAAACHGAEGVDGTQPDAAQPDGTGAQSDGAQSDGAQPEATGPAEAEPAQPKPAEPAEPPKMARPAPTAATQDSTYRQRAGSAPTPPRDEGSQLPEGRKETLAERSQRRWEERKAADQSGGDEGARAERGRRASAASPAEPTAGRSSSAEETSESEAEEIDKTSSLSRPPKMPAVKRRPREEE